MISGVRSRCRTCATTASSTSAAGTLRSGAFRVALPDGVGGDVVAIQPAVLRVCDGVIAWPPGAKIRPRSNAGVCARVPLARATVFSARMAWTLLAKAISQAQLVEGTRLTEGKALCGIDP